MSENKKHYYESVQITDGSYKTDAGNEYTVQSTNLLAGKLPLSVMMITPKKAPTAVVQLVHGMCEYKERYLPFMQALVDEGYACIIHDHRGHGASVLDDADYGFMYDSCAQDLVEDAHQITVFAKRKWAGLPVILFGHSMGSLVVRTYLKKYDYEPTAVILSGPPCDNRGSILAFILSKVLSAIKGPHSHSALIDSVSVGVYAKAFPEEDSYAWICSDNQVSGQYSKNPLCNFKFTLNGYCCLTGLLCKTYSKRGWCLTNPSLPILFSAGADDPCAGSEKDFKDTVMFMWKLGYYHVQWKRYKGLRHEILNEKESDIVVKDYLRFIKKSLRIKNVPNSRH